MRLGRKEDQALSGGDDQAHCPGTKPAVWPAPVCIVWLRMFGFAIASPSGTKPYPKIPLAPEFTKYLRASEANITPFGSNKISLVLGTAATRSIASARILAIAA